MTCPAVILAGGRSTRMGGGNKCLLSLGGASILSRIVLILSPQVGTILINSNSDPDVFAEAGLDVLPDIVPGRLGPLAGIHTAMCWAHAEGAPHVLTVASDTPYLPQDLMACLRAVALPHRPVIARSGGELHPVIGLWPVELAERLADDLKRGDRQVRAWLNKVSFTIAEFGSQEPDPFWNINTQRDWELARARHC